MRLTSETETAPGSTEPSSLAASSELSESHPLNESNESSELSKEDRGAVGGGGVVGGSGRITLEELPEGGGSKRADMVNPSVAIVEGGWVSWPGSEAGWDTPRVESDVVGSTGGFNKEAVSCNGVGDGRREVEGGEVGGVGGVATAIVDVEDEPGEDPAARRIQEWRNVEG
jgi:hypothetical protein